MSHQEKHGLTNRKNTLAPLTQAERLGAELLKLKPDVTKDDKREAIYKIGVHMNTVQTYLNGRGRDAGLASRMIAFYKKQIANRNKVLA